MPHADAALVPPEITSKPDFYSHLLSSLEALFEGERNWVVILSNAASVIFNAMAAWDGGRGRSVNWAGFYLLPNLFPRPPRSRPQGTLRKPHLLLGPFQGRPACQLTYLPSHPHPPSFPIPNAGVCATAFLLSSTQLVSDIEKFPGHIACDAETRSEVVVPLLWKGTPIGVLDLDCTVEAGFDEEDRVGLEKVAKLIVDSCEWWSEDE